MTFVSVLAVVSLVISLAAFILAVKAILDSRWDRFLVTVEGRATVLTGENNSSAMLITVEITNVGRVPVTVTDVVWTIFEDEILKTEEYDPDSQSDKWFGSTSHWASELPMIIQPNSSYTFKYYGEGEKAEPDLFGQAEATFIYRPSSPKKVTHASTRKRVHSELRPYPENKPSLPPDSDTQ